MFGFARGEETNSVIRRYHSNRRIGYLAIDYTSKRYYLSIGLLQLGRKNRLGECPEPAPNTHLSSKILFKTQHFWYTEGDLELRDRSDWILFMTFDRLRRPLSLTFMTGVINKLKKLNILYIMSKI